jgi:hypothetical protein
MTDLHTDDVGALAHFRESEILVSRAESESASGIRGKARGFVPQPLAGVVFAAPLRAGAGALRALPAEPAHYRGGRRDDRGRSGHAKAHVSVVVEEGP